MEKTIQNNKNKKLLYIACSVVSACIIFLTVFCCILAGKNSKLTSKTKTQETTIATLSNKQKSLEDKITSLETKDNTQQQKINELETKNNSQQQKINELENEIQENANDIYLLKEKTNDLQDKVNQIVQLISSGS